MAEQPNSRMDQFEKRALKNGWTCAERVSIQKRIVAGVAAAFLVLFGMLALPATSSARVAIGISVNFGPPPLPVYAQPPCPGPGFIWTPGYWAYAPDAGYYWVPGAWVTAPFVGALWTPGYWGFSGGVYLWHPGYWGTRVGFYGGINYGFGYTGYGYHGGYWNHGRFFYNRAFNRLDGREFRHAYYRREDEHFREGRVSYYGGPHGIHVRPTHEQRDAVRFRHFGPVGQQVRQERFARRDPRQRARVNHGRPDIAATRRAGEFRGRTVRATRAGGPYREPAQRMNGFREFHRGASASAPRHSAPQQRVERRGFARENTRAPQRANGSQRSHYQARSQGHGSQQWHGQSQHQDRGNGGNGHDHGHGNEHGRGGRR